MAVIRQSNFVSQQRIEVSDLRAVESAITHDFDIGFGRIFAGQSPLVVRGFTIDTTSKYGTNPNDLAINVSNGLIVHYGASDAGSIYEVPSDRVLETLNSSTNSRVLGSFNTGDNFIGLDLVRSADATTSDTVKLNSYPNNTEFSLILPKARILDYIITISTIAFNVTSNILPIAIVNVDYNGKIASISDARKLAFRLGAGGDNPDPYLGFSWPERSETGYLYDSLSDPNPFLKGDKEIKSMKEWMDAMMHSLWEVKGGETWFSPQTNLNTQLIYTSNILAGYGDNFGTDGTSIFWQGIKIAFDNGGGAIYYNDIIDNAITGEILQNGECLYVDYSRTSNASLTLQKGSLSLLNYSSNPGKRLVVAWMVDGAYYTRDRGFQVGRPLAPVATTSSEGVVRLNHTSSTPSNPVVPVYNSNKVIGQGLSRNGLGSATLTIGGSADDDVISILSRIINLTANAGNDINITTSGGGKTDITGPVTIGHTSLSLDVTCSGDFAIRGTSSLSTGIVGISTNDCGIVGFGADNFAGIKGEPNPIGTTNVTGVWGIGKGTGYGVKGEIGSTSSGIAIYGDGSGATTNGTGIKGVGKGSGYGIWGTIGATGSIAIYGDGSGATTNGTGIKGVGKGNGYGIWGIGGDDSGTGVYAVGGVVNGYGVKAYGVGTGHGVAGFGDLGGGFGVIGTGGAANSTGVRGIGYGSGYGIWGANSNLAFGSCAILGEGGNTGVKGTGLIGVLGDGSGYNSIGVLGTASGDNTYAISGTASGNGIGVRGVGAKFGYGVYGIGGSEADASTFGDGASSSATNANGVKGTAKGTGVGIWGLSSNTSGSYGVFGEGYGTGATYGVFGQTSNDVTGGAGVYGKAGNKNTSYGVVCDGMLRLIDINIDPTGISDGCVYHKDGTLYFRWNGSTYTVDMTVVP